MSAVTDPGRSSDRRWAALRFALGQVQMAGVVLSLGLLIYTGVSNLTIWAAAVTAAFFLTSLALFGGGRREG